MANDHVVDFHQSYDQDKEYDIDKPYDVDTPYATPSVTPATGFRREQTTKTSPPRSCVVCRHTLFLSYFNCCAICLSLIPCGRQDGHQNEQLPTTATTSTTVETVHCSTDLHCRSSYCRYTHKRWLLLFFAACEALPAAGALMLIIHALTYHNWFFLRFGGMMVVQWWQIFVLPRQWHAGQSIVTGQLVACSFMVWFYVEGREQWHW